MDIMLMYLLIEAVITGYIIFQINAMLWDMKDSRNKLRMFKFMQSRSFTMLFNFSISSLLTMFTGGGMTAGFANLGSSILVGVVLPFILRWKFPIYNLEHRVARMSTRKSRRESKKREAF